MKFTQLHATGSDETAPYSVTEFKAKTVGEFINEVLDSHKGDWGYFHVSHPNLRGYKCEYRYGKIVSPISENANKYEIESVESSGGWSRMDYFIKVKL